MKFSELEGKTITRARLMGTVGYDDRHILKLEFTEGKPLYLTGGYGGYTGKSMDEYVQLIGLSEAPFEGWDDGYQVHYIDE